MLLLDDAQNLLLFYLDRLEPFAKGEHRAYVKMGLDKGGDTGVGEFFPNCRAGPGDLSCLGSEALAPYLNV